MGVRAFSLKRYLAKCTIYLQAEAELAQQTPGRIASNSTAGSPVIIPRLPHNPTRVDRLYVESLREHSKVYSILIVCMYVVTVHILYLAGF